MHKSSVYLSDKLKRQLAEHATRTHVSEAETIRNALTDYLSGQIGVRDQVLVDTPKPGRFVGVGVGPGPADMVTVAALSALRRADRVFAPCTSAEAIGRAETIVRAAAPDVSVERLAFVMRPDHSARAAALNAACDTIVDHLNQGEEVAFITLGDPNTYSTVSSVAAGVVARRPATPVATVAGILAFQALAARAETPLVDEQQTLVLVPASIDDDSIQRELTNPERTVVFYKGGGRIGAVADALGATGRSGVVGELIGMNGERVAPIDEFRGRPASYLSCVVAPAPSGAGPTPTREIT